MPQIKDFNLDPAQAKIAAGRSKTIQANLVINSSRKYSLSFSMSESNNYFFVGKGNTEVKTLTFPNEPGESVGDIVSTKSLTIKLRSSDASTRVAITALVEDSVPSQSLPRTKFLKTE